MGVTLELATWAVKTNVEDLPAEVVYEAKRDIINVIGVALYAAMDPSLSILLNAFEAEGGKPRASVWGTSFRTSLANAALANGYLAHLEDYDDTHFPTVLHPTSPTLPAAFALAEAEGKSGRELVAAVALGIEAACRVSMAVHPWHYDEGWHITGTMGVFGSAVAAGRLAGLDPAGMVAALGIAGTQAAGVREVFGSMSKPLHAGRAAQAGLVAATLAKGGFTSTTAILEGRRGVGEVMSSDRDLGRVTEGLGKRWEIFQNGLKPYACGVVSHAAIDAAVALRSRPGFDADAVESIEAKVHHLVPELMGRAEPSVGLEGKFSVQHCIAVGLVDGAAYPDQFSDAKVADARLTRLRRKVQLVVEDGIAEDQVILRLKLKDGSVLEERVEHATGSPENPLSDVRVNEKFLTLASRTLGDSKAKELLEKLWRLDELASVAEVVPATK